MTPCIEAVVFYHYCMTLRYAGSGEIPAVLLQDCICVTLGLEISQEDEIVAAAARRPALPPQSLHRSHPGPAT